MNLPLVPIETLADLLKGLTQREPCNLQLQTSILSPHSITLPPGFWLTGKDKDACMLSFSDGDGIGLTADNRVERLTVMTTPSARAIYARTGLSDLGRIRLSELTVTGQVSAR